MDIVCKTENFPDGQKIVEARVRYSRPLYAGSVTSDAYSVRDRTVESVRVEKDTAVIRLKENEPFSTVLPTREEEPKGMAAPLRRRPVELYVKQKKPIRDPEGRVFPAWEDWLCSTKAIEPVVECFRQWEYAGMRYNLYCPRRFAAEKYPMVVFLHDARPCSDDPKVTLSQGSGAICWAEEDWQSEHPCFVLAPQIGSVMVNDQFEVTGDLEKLFGLIQHVVRAYPVDGDRIYLTGQSMGCMASCELLSRWHETFAGGLLAAGQWSPERMKKCGRSNLWVLVSEHDEKAFVGMNRVMEAIESTGATVSHSFWDGKATDLERLAAAEALKSGIHYTVFQGSSVVPEGKPDHSGTNHEYTWRLVYSIRTLREWLFRQTRK